METTCQICARTIKSKSGIIAHHGYRRPYAGSQTASCPGARYAPYEVSCDRLREVIEEVRGFIAAQEKALANFLANPPQTITVLERRSAWGEAKPEKYEKPENFDINSHRRYTPRTYENAYADRKYEYEQTIKFAKSDLERMERRLGEWEAPDEIMIGETSCS